jgi:hypothetical protein
MRHFGELAGRIVRDSEPEGSQTASNFAADPIQRQNSSQIIGLFAARGDARPPISPFRLPQRRFLRR